MPHAYCTAEDVARKLDQTINSLRSDQRERYQTRAESASQQWDQTTNAPMRRVRVGAAEAPATWEYHDARHLRGHPPVHVSLDHGDIVPIDATKGDTIEIRTGRDSWDDVTDERGDSWTLDNERGQLKLYRFLINRLRFESQAERFVRLTYRHGGLGGDRDRGTETSLAASVTDSDTTLSVDNAARFPEPPFLVSLGQTTAEYARVTAIDRGADDLTVTRGVQSTSATAFDADAPVLYAPSDVREAVAARAAENIALNDDIATSLPDDGQLTSVESKADRLKSEWESACAQYADVMTL